MDDGQSAIKNTTAVILVGGLGLRLRSVVPDKAKPMAEINGRPFLEYLVKRLMIHGVKNVVLCVSYMREQIIDYFSKNYAGQVAFAIEQEPLGTGGALKNAENLLPERFLLLNGDTFALVNYKDLLSLHINNNALITMALHAGSGNRGGRVKLEGNRITDFVEKGTETGPGLITSGVYAIERSVLSKIPKGAVVSLEKEVFPKLMSEKATIIGYVQKEKEWGIDMGEPDRYAYLQQNTWFLEK